MSGTELGLELGLDFLAYVSGVNRFQQEIFKNYHRRARKESHGGSGGPLREENSRAEVH